MLFLTEAHPPLEVGSQGRLFVCQGVTGLVHVSSGTHACEAFQLWRGD
jgi:hypothetical protein